MISVYRSSTCQSYPHVAGLLTAAVIKTSTAVLAGAKVAGAGGDSQPQAALSDLPLALTGPQCMAEGQGMDRHSAEVMYPPHLHQRAAFVWSSLESTFGALLHRGACYCMFAVSLPAHVVSNSKGNDIQRVL